MFRKKTNKIMLKTFWLVGLVSNITFSLVQNEELYLKFLHFVLRLLKGCI